MVTFTLENGNLATLRASGTEPKIKYYIELITAPGRKERLAKKWLHFLKFLYDFAVNWAQCSRNWTNWRRTSWRLCCVQSNSVWWQGNRHSSHLIKFPILCKDSMFLSIRAMTIGYTVARVSLCHSIPNSIHSLYSISKLWRDSIILSFIVYVQSISYLMQKIAYFYQDSWRVLFLFPINK